MSRLWLLLPLLLLLSPHAAAAAGAQEEPGVAECPGQRCPCAGGGAAGIPGLHGQLGATGRDGRDGRDGSAGPPGPKGDVGNPGVDGAKGETGFPGRPGMQGMGQPGMKGDPGDCAKMPKSAFTAKLSAPRPASGSPIKFDVILTNSGNHYDPSTGKFTCVHPGAYYFVMHACVYSASVFTHLKRNGEVVHKFHSAWLDSWPGVALSGGAVLSLKAGDQVWLEVPDAHNGIFSRSDIDSSFSGFLLSPE
uniref:Complement C1q tumor necrosis factor-related protein 5-like isoform X1 n=1 Tax=Petromyzon marinus TaxID=7757 RepID=A0AAJ7XIA6_PETMA|nr:complement C1q tumor necrosis factor-related protein 5-like isoform X1 [Petromyzon marinus]